MIFRRSRWLLVTVLLFLAAGSFLGAGRLVTHEDPLQKSDAVYVLGGTWAARWVEALDLYREGYASTIVLSPGYRDAGERLLASRGIVVPTPADVARRVLTEQLAVPGESVLILEHEVDNTAQEAEAIKALALAHHWSRMIVITDRSSTRRAGFAMRRVLGADVQVIVRASRHESFDPNRWWSSRQDFRLVFYEAPKLLAYWLGLKG